jgi:Protein of unknown function (DUF2510)
MTTMTPAPAGWYADPMGHHEFRYWDSVRWTDRVSDRGITASEVFGAAPTMPSPTPAAVVPQAPVAARSDMPPMAPPPAGATRDIAVPTNGWLYWGGQMVLLLGVVGYVLIATVGWGLSLGAAGTGNPPIYLGSRSVGLLTEYYVPGMLLALLPWLVIGFLPRADRKFRNRRSRETLAAQLGLRSWRVTTAYKGRSYRWRGIVATVLAALALVAPIAAATAASSAGFTLAPVASVLIIAGGLALMGTVMMLFAPYRRVRVDNEGRVVDAAA